MADTVSAFEQVTRERVDNLREDFDQHVLAQNKSLDKIWQELAALRTEMMRRLPLWATFLIGFLMSIATGAAVYLLKGG